jgi:sterol desaturase/sphingolipid hydroxylase (fatty acid hydroxylase superfamily)
MVSFEMFIGVTLAIIWTADVAALIYTGVLLKTAALDRGIMLRPASTTLEKDKAAKLNAFRQRWPLTLANMFFFKPVIAVGGLILTRSLISLSYSHWLWVLYEFVAILLIADFVFYWVHRWMHVNKLVYKKVHLVHHRANRPLPTDYMYESPIEIMLENTGTFAAILILQFIQPVSFLSVWLYGAFRAVHAVQTHSGVVFPGPLFRLSGTEEHDLHHFKYNGNYAFMFKFFDRALGTLLKP